MSELLHHQVHDQAPLSSSIMPLISPPANHSEYSTDSKHGGPSSSQTGSNQGSETSRNIPNSHNTAATDSATKNTRSKSDLDGDKSDNVQSTSHHAHQSETSPNPNNLNVDQDTIQSRSQSTQRHNHDIDPSQPRPVSNGAKSDHPASSNHIDSSHTYVNLTPRDQNQHVSGNNSTVDHNSNIITTSNKKVNDNTKDDNTTLDNGHVIVAEPSNEVVSPEHVSSPQHKQNENSKNVTVTIPSQHTTSSTPSAYTPKPVPATPTSIQVKSVAAPSPDAIDSHNPRPVGMPDQERPAPILPPVTASKDSKVPKTGGRVQQLLHNRASKEESLRRQINSAHPEFELTYLMIIGMRTSIGTMKDIVEPTPEHFSIATKQNFPREGSTYTPAYTASCSEFKFKDYCPTVFGSLRRFFGINPIDYINSVCGNYNYIEFISNSKSGEFFFYTHDFKYMIKTISQQESLFLRSILPAYYQHITSNPNTLLARFYGMHRVRSTSLHKTHFLIMSSVFDTHCGQNVTMSKVYDLKGSSQGRTVSLKEREKTDGCVFKDNDFLEDGARIILQPVLAKKLREQLQRDVAFLEKLGIMDYSLLLGILDLSQLYAETTAANTTDNNEGETITMTTTTTMTDGRSSQQQQQQPPITTTTTFTTTTTIPTTTTTRPPSAPASPSFNTRTSTSLIAGVPVTTGGYEPSPPQHPIVDIQRVPDDVDTHFDDSPHNTLGRTSIMTHSHSDILTGGNVTHPIPLETLTSSLHNASTLDLGRKPKHNPRPVNYDSRSTPGEMQGEEVVFAPLAQLERTGTGDDMSHRTSIYETGTHPQQYMTLTTGSVGHPSHVDVHGTGQYTNPDGSPVSIDVPINPRLDKRARTRTINFHDKKEIDPDGNKIDKKGKKKDKKLNKTMDNKTSYNIEMMGGSVDDTTTTERLSGASSQHVLRSSQRSDKTHKTHISTTSNGTAPSSPEIGSTSTPSSSPVLQQQQQPPTPGAPSSDHRSTTATATTLDNNTNTTNTSSSIPPQPQSTTSNSNPTTIKVDIDDDPMSRPLILTDNTDLTQAGTSRSIFTQDIGGIRGYGEQANTIYYLGIIDILTVYNWRKRGETVLKTLRYSKSEISSVAPNEYAERFLHFMNQRAVWATDDPELLKRQMAGSKAATTSAGGPLEHESDKDRKKREKEEKAQREKEEKQRKADAKAAEKQAKLDAKEAEKQAKEAEAKAKLEAKKRKQQQPLAAPHVLPLPYRSSMSSSMMLSSSSNNTTTTNNLSSLYHWTPLQQQQSSNDIVAVLYQALEPPIINGTRKDRKPGGYSDSGADIAYTLQQSGIHVITPVSSPDVNNNMDWVFPDTPDGIQTALDSGATILWANTVLYSGHPLENVMDKCRIVGQLPAAVDAGDDKYKTNAMLYASNISVAKSILAAPYECKGNGIYAVLDLDVDILSSHGLIFPLVVKPVRGRGSQGVSIVYNMEQLQTAAHTLISSQRFGEQIMIEQALSGQEITITVIPCLSSTSSHGLTYRCLPPVVRTGHIDGVVPYNGVVPVSQNSYAMMINDNDHDQATTMHIQNVLNDCINAAYKVNSRCIMRIDCRADSTGKYYLFDLNMKPNLTGSGRPNRDNQDGLCTIAARAAGCSYSQLLLSLLSTAWKQLPMMMVKENNNDNDDIVNNTSTTTLQTTSLTLHEE